MGKRKDAAAVSLGRRGGKVGGAARATRLTARERVQIAQHAANTRWGRSTPAQRKAAATKASRAAAAARTVRAKQRAIRRGKERAK